MQGMQGMQGAARGMTAAEARNMALAKAVSKNTSAVREGASALAKLDSSVLKDVVRSLLSDGESCIRVARAQALSLALSFSVSLSLSLSLSHSHTHTHTR
jgi:hypothetical protein